MKYFGLIITSLLILHLNLFAQQAEVEKPNIVLIYADDLGWKDVGYQSEGNFKTPNLDKLVKQGMVFTDAYSNAANCQPARACLLSGNYGGRHHVFAVQSTSRGPKNLMRLIPIQNKDGLADDDETIADMLKAVGYATGHFGKWHLYTEGGEKSPGGGGALPSQQGFDVSYDSFGEGELPEGAKGNKKGPESDPKGVFDLSKQACDFMEVNREKPFFVYLAHHAPHGPHQARKSTQEKINDIYKGCIYDLDASVGRVFAKIRELGIEKKTLVIFTSDNGGARSQEPLRGNKGSYYEGGIREPMIAVWDGVIEEASQCSSPVMQVDFMPTFLEMAGAKTDKVIDGESLLPLFRQSGELKRESIFWHMPGYLNKPVTRGRDKVFRTRPVTVIRKGKWKLHMYLEEWVLDGGADKIATNNSVELYNLEDDLGEHEDLANKETEVRDQLVQEITEWHITTGAPIPRQRNPKYDPSAKPLKKDKKIKGN